MSHAGITDHDAEQLLRELVVSLCGLAEDADALVRLGHQDATRPPEPALYLIDIQTAPIGLPLRLPPEDGALTPSIIQVVEKTWELRAVGSRAVASLLRLQSQLWSDCREALDALALGLGLRRVGDARVTTAARGSTYEARGVLTIIATYARLVSAPVPPTAERIRLNAESWVENTYTVEVDVVVEPPDAPPPEPDPDPE